MPEIGDSARGKDLGKQGGIFYYRRCPDCGSLGWSRQKTKLESTTLKTCPTCARTPPTVFRPQHR